MRTISKAVSNNGKLLCEQMAGQCQFAKPNNKAIEWFNRKPYYLSVKEEKSSLGASR